MPALARYPQLTAILRGIRPQEILDVAAALVERGVHAIEVPLNSPEPFASIGRLQQAFGGQCLCGAGTVLSVAQVDQVHATGARLIVAPNTDAASINSRPARPSAELMLAANSIRRRMRRSSRRLRRLRHGRR